jgi:hypothetical protein
LIVPNAIVTGVRETGLIPGPDKLTNWGEPPAESLMVSAPLTVPPVAGLKVTSIVQVPAAFTWVPAQLSVSAKAPLVASEVTLNEALPGLLRVTACGELVVPAG